MNAIVRFLSRPISPVPSAFSPLLMLIALAPRPAEAAPTSAPQESDAQAGPANYDLAARFAPYRISEMVHSTSVDPQWIEGTDRFWYEWENADGKFFYIVDPGAGSRTLLFDNDRIAAELTRITRDPWDGQHLPIRNIRFISDNILHFEVESSQDEEVEDEDEEETEEDQDEEEDDSGISTRKRVHHFEYTVSTRTLRELEDYEAPDNHPDWASVSPDGQTVVFARDHNLFMMGGDDYEQILEARRGKSGDEADDAEDDVEVTETRLTTDGEKYYTYEANFTGRGETNVTLEEEKDDRKAASISWARDSERFALIRRDNREVGELWVVHVVGNGNDRPELETYSYEMAGEESVTQEEIIVYDLASKSQVTVSHEPWKDEDLRITTQRQFDYPDSEEPDRSLWISDDSEELYFVRLSRDRHRAAVMVADAGTGNARMLFVDSLNTYIETRPVEMLAGGDILWWSERDGWAHLYLYGPDGELRQRLTEGPWHVDGIVGVDEARGFVFFTGQGREEGEDPYYAHLYRVSLNGTGLTLLNPGDYNHQFEIGESNRFFVNNYSRVNTTPMSALYDASGQRIMDLGEADFGALDAAGYHFPEPYQVEAADGVTDIYGVMYKPYDFDPSKTYPIVAYVYPGPQTESVSKSWSANPYEQALAQFGMIVVTMGNRGGHPDRSKWYHNYGYGDLRDYGLADKKAVIEQLADRHDFIDVDKVGIYGHSGGGFMSTAAMLVYPDFFKVAVSSAGNHNNDVYNRSWSETHHGVKEVVDDEGNVSFEYDIERNSDLAANLKGHLLLTTGDNDNNVHHAGTFRMAEALIRANKRFDFFIFPGQRHGFGDMSDYWFWLRAEYFVKHLLGDTRWDVDIIPLQMNAPQTR
ncbi:MAG: DPP IV N-terminal domain-containing protein [Gammaproteobacteria bacterium]|nr:DPP IV N-terminal domain-containing protein [Gammaproteobacteria bacterium]